MALAAPIRMGWKRATVFVDGRNVHRLAEPRLVRSPKRLAPRCVERAPCVPMVRAPPAHDLVACFVASSHVIGPGHLERGLDGLAAARDRVDARFLHREVASHLVRVGLHGLGGELGAVDVVHRFGLFRHGSKDRPVSVADADHQRAARCIEVALSVGVPDRAALGLLVALEDDLISAAGAQRHTTKPTEAITPDFRSCLISLAPPIRQRRIAVEHDLARRQGGLQFLKPFFRHQRMVQVQRLQAGNGFQDLRAVVRNSGRIHAQLTLDRHDEREPQRASGLIGEPCAVTHALHVHKVRTIRSELPKP